MAEFEGPLPDSNPVSESIPVPEPFPSRSKIAAALVNGVHTDAMSLSFADKIMITLSQGGRLAHWVHVPLDTPLPDPTAAPHFMYDEDSEPSDLLPMAHLTATSLLGGTVPEREIVGQLVATQVASAISTRNPEERRLVVVGLGLEKAETKETYLQLVNLALDVL